MDLQLAMVVTGTAMERQRLQWLSVHVTYKFALKPTNDTALAPSQPYD